MQSISQSKIDKSNIRLLPDIGNIIPYKQFETFLFSGEVPEINRMLLLHKGFVIEDETDNSLFFILSKLEEYMDFVAKNANFNRNEICPINFINLYSSMGYDIIPNKGNIRLIQKLTEFKEFLVNKQVKNDLNSKVILNFFWPDKFNGIVTESNDQPYIVSIKFPKNGKPFVLIVSDYKNDYKNSISLNSIGSDAEIEFEKVYKSWVQDVLMDNPDNYIISCLTNITGSEDFAKMIFESHKTKKEYNLPVYDLDTILDFKSTKIQNKYHEEFSQTYPDLMILKEGTMYLNFEGFNKYLLNLETNHLSTFEAKEQINTLYYNVMDELVNCYERLYEYTKLI